MDGYQDRDNGIDRYMVYRKKIDEDKTPQYRGRC